MDILQYKTKVFSVAEYYRGAGIKQSEWPKMMMPFFTLRLVESRLIRERDKMEAEIGGVTDDNRDDFVDYFKTKTMGYNDYVIRQHKDLRTICMNDKTMESDFEAYLKGFDAETKRLLGVAEQLEDEKTKDKFLDISSVEGTLKSKNIFFDVVKVWSEIDLVPFDNSEITTLEEHIKREWADMSAETSGEQYTPQDIISLISEIVATRVDTKKKDFLSIYDPTCGGGSLLFGMEDRLQSQTERPIKTFGMEWESSLYALSKIESRFRKDSDIRYGNTLTQTVFIDNRFNVIVANPPYGVDWKGYKKEIDNDQTGRFIDTPAVSDGQLLFDQHIVYHLDEKDGIAVIVNNGSSLFSGDAGSGESNIRKYFFEKDWVEAVVQMPTQEFFNTGIYTYLWILNKNKASDRKDKVLMIDGSNFWELLKKSRGDKRRQMNEEHRAKIVEAFVNGTENEYCKVFSKYHFYYNKQKIVLFNVDSDKKYIKENVKLELGTINSNGKKIEGKTVDIADADEAADIISNFDYKNDSCFVTDSEGNKYFWNVEKETVLKGNEALGCGKIETKIASKKATKTLPARFEVSATLTPDCVNDYEIISYSPNEEENTKLIDDFLAKYVFLPFEKKDFVVGAEINFNKIFYKPEVLPKAADLLSEIKDLDNELKTLENQFNLDAE
jgi:type I restriction enzyme M protein